MKGFLFGVLVLVCAVFAGANYLGYKNTGTLPVNEWIAQAKSALKNSVNWATGEEASTKATVKISKWTDAKGVIHYENRPVNGADTIEVDPNDNVLSLAPVAEASSSEEAKPKTINEEMEALRAAKQAQMEAIINK
jgi:hypothetical protein